MSKLKNKKKEKVNNKANEIKVKKKRKNLFKSLFVVDGMYNMKALFKNILLPVVGAFIIWLLTKNGMDTYNSLKKPVFTPPSVVFIVVWSILYLLMGIASYRIFMNNKEGKNDNNAYFTYLLQLILNFLWAIVFFNLKLYGISFIVIIVLLILIIITTIKFLKVDGIAGTLMLPYILWVTFASVLSFYIWMLNEM